MTKNSGYEKITETVQEEKISFFSSLFFQWMSIIFKKGSRRAIDENDLLPLKEENSTFFLSEKLQSNWKKERESSKRHGRGSPKLWKSVLNMISIKEAIIVALTGSLRTFSDILQPLLLKYLIESLRKVEQKHNYFLYACALGIGITELFAALNIHHFCYQCEMIGIKISGALKGLVYEKVLLLSKDSLLRFSTGHVIDLVSNDVQRLEADTVRLFLNIPFCILQLVMVSSLLLHFIGWQSTMGITLLCILLPCFGGLSYAGAALRFRTAAVSDHRISLISQVISGIRAIKSYAWEEEYQQKIRNVRRQEVSFILKKSAILSTIATLEYISTPMAVLVTVVSLSLTGQPLTPVNAFILLSLINLLRESFCVNLAYGFLQSYDAYVSLNRIQDFLLLDNLTSTSPTRKNKEEIEKVPVTRKVTELEHDHILLVENAMQQEKDRDEGFSLQNVEFTTKKGSLVALSGPVGSGKSTLLATIAGEGSSRKLAISCRGTIIYVPQIAWLFSGTIRENILFGEPYEESKYSRVIQACALGHDIQQFPDGDKAVVGERGVALSGGQRARVSLARAVYADADLYLLDDPLSALDFNVGRHIFTHCIMGLLGEKTRLIASHHEQVMREADDVIVLLKGEMLGKGSFEELKAKGLLNTTVDPLYKKDKESSESLAEQGTGEKEISDLCERTMPDANEFKVLRVSKEDCANGLVSTKLYWNYFKSGTPLPVIIAGICFCFITQAMLVSPDVWLSLMVRKRPEDQRDKRNLAIYGGLVGVAFILLVIRAFGFYSVSLRSSERLHDKMVVAVLHAPVFFFDSNPVGRILNRFSRDIGCMDEVLPKTFLQSVQLFLLLFTSILLPTITNPWVLLAVVPIAVSAGLFSRYYLKTSRELQRLESICRSPVYSHISETLDGLDTIRTRKREEDFVARFHRCQDVHTKSFILLLAGGRWLGVRLDILSALLTGTVALAAVFVSEDPAFVGLSLVYVVQTVNLTQFAVRKLTEVENLMNAVERVIDYTKLDSEPGYNVKRLPPEKWPDKGSINFQDISLAYYPGGPQVLRNISLSIKAGAKIGVVGRTGSGKSSFVAALMRMPEAEGDILIDDVVLRSINLRGSRQAITVLGQNPVLFSGSMRKNLDIVEQFQDADLWRALEQVQMKNLVENLEGQLDYELLEQGANLSVGERQLICLARVLLLNKKIVILDEPTAHVDPDTEQTIWNVVHEKLKHSTVITIAHRLNTVSDCDKILVLDNGKVDGFDNFNVLLNRSGTKLNDMT